MPAMLPALPAISKTVKPADAFAVAKHRLAAAYSDCHRHHRGSYVPKRNLDFCCPVTLSVNEARRLLARYVGGYNAFEPRLLKKLPEGCRVRLAREASVCLYVETEAVLDETKTRRDLRCDKFTLYQVLAEVRTYRLWWD